MSTVTTTTRRRDARVGGATGMEPETRRAVPSGRPPGLPAGEAATADRGTVRPFLRRWLTAAMLLAAAVLATLYISNAIAVNDLMTDIASLERDRDAARGANEKLRAELLKLMAVERVTSIAASRLGMVQPVQPPLSLARGNASRGESPRNATPQGDSASATAQSGAGDSATVR